MRNVRATSSVNRRIQEVGRVHEPAPGTKANNECDTNADTCCLGKNFIVLEYTQRVADVYAYDKAIKPIENIPIVSGATAWHDIRTKQTYILVINEALYYGEKLDHSLINPNQVRSYGIPFWDNPFDKERGLKIELDATDIQLRAEGTKIYFETTTPTQRELETCTRVYLTSRKDWNPTRTTLGKVATEQTKECQDGLKELMIRKLAETQRKYDKDLEDVPTRQTYTSTQRHTKATADVLAERFAIGIQRARDTLSVTFQRAVRSALLPISRRYRADRQLNTKQLQGKFATDTLWFSVKSIRGYKASQIYSHKCGFKKVYHLRKADNENVGNTLKAFISDFGATEHLTYDGAAVQIGNKTIFQQTLRRYDIKNRVSGPRRPNENPAEAAIRELKRGWYRLKTKKNIPDRLWCFGIEYISETQCFTVNSSKYSNQRTPMEIITGETPDISEYLDFGFYDWVWYRTNAGLAPAEIGRWLGVSHRVGNSMSYWILPKSGIPVSCSTVQRLTNLELKGNDEQETMKRYTEKLERKWNTESSDLRGELESSKIPHMNVFSLEDESKEFLEEFNKVISNDEIKNAEDVKQSDLFHNEGNDTLINMELGIRRGENNIDHAVVKRRALDEEGIPIGVPSATNNPLTDTRAYEVEFIDGRIEVLTANVIAENLLAQVDEEGHRTLLLEQIEDYKEDESITKRNDQFYITASGLKKKKRTTKGWTFYTRWRDGSGDWIDMKDLKDSYPVQLADFAIANNIQEESAFAWWVPYVTRKREAIIKKIKSKYWQRTHKYGIRIPKTVEEAKRIDKENGDRRWQDSLKQEMTNNRIAFERYDGLIKDLIGYEEITGHVIFDVKLSENYRRKARFVADGHKLETPASVTYSTVVSRDSVRILLMVAALNGLDIQGCDVQNAFLTADNREKNWIRAGPEFGEEEGQIFIVRRALYGLKSASAAFRSFMAKKFDELGFKSSNADPDVWMRPARKDTGEEYYEYLISYVDDILCISQDAKQVLEDLRSDGKIKYKNDKIEPPEMYLGARLQPKTVARTGQTVWSVSSHDYIKATIDAVKESIKSTRWKLLASTNTPMVASYRPEMDGTPELSAEELTMYQEFIGMLRWALELGRVDINHEVSLLSQYQASPREGHMEQVMHIFHYLSKKPKRSIYMDPSLPSLNFGEFQQDVSEFKEYYREANELMPHRMPKPRGKSVMTYAYVDASHGANKKTRRSHTGYMLFVNRAPVKWISRRQQTVETSAFSSEFIAMKQCIEDIEHLRFKLRLFGIPINEQHPETYVYCDNESLVKNTSLVESTLNKKHSAVAYHFSRWNVAASVIKVAWVRSQDNLADAFTKLLSEPARDHLFNKWTY